MGTPKNLAVKSSITDNISKEFVKPCKSIGMYIMIMERDVDY